MICVYTRRLYAYLMQLIFSGSLSDSSAQEFLARFPLPAIIR